MTENQTYLTEAQVETYLRKKVKALGGLCLKLPAVYVEGIPDRLILLPGGIALFVETKRPEGGRVAPLQEYWQKKLRRLGFVSEIVKNYEEIDELFGGTKDEMVQRFKKYAQASQRTEGSRKGKGNG